MRVDHIHRLLERKREVHPELAEPLTWESLRRIAEREHVGLFSKPLPNPACLLRFDGTWNIVVSSAHPARRRTMNAAHELAHLWLHVDEQEGRFEPCINYSYPGNTDPREQEADFLATALLAPKRLADRLEPAAMLRRASALPAVRAKDRPVLSAEERFPVAVAATTFWQPTIKSLLGKRHWMATPLVVEANMGPDDPLQDRFPFPIRVEIRGRKVGYLSREDADRFRRVYRRKWITVPAVIMRDVRRREYGVRLELDLDCRATYNVRNSA